MPTQPATTVRHFGACSGWKPRVLPAMLALVALLTTAAGITLLVLHARGSIVGHVLIPASMVLLACSYPQWRAAWRLWTDPQLAARSESRFGLAFWRRLFVGAFFAYAVAVTIGPARQIEFGLLAAMVAWYTALLLPVWLPASVFERLRARASAWAPRRLGLLVFGAILLVVGTEVGLRAFKSFEQYGVFSTGSATSPTPPNGLAALEQGVGTNADRVRSLAAAPLRVAVLLDETAASGAQRNAYLVRIEQALPGVEIVPVALVESWSCAGPDELAEQLSAARPDVVLAMLSVCQDVTRAAPEASWFDWRQFELARLLGAGETVSDAPSEMAASANFESFCGRLAPQLAACRTPIDGDMHRRWRRTFGAVDSLLDVCRDANLAVALVVVPGEFQVNRTLCETLVRRAGYTTEQVDVELPQRKLTSYAASRRLPLIDLLPQLRLCGQSPYERHAARWSDEGHTVAATAIGGWLEGRFGSQLGVSTRLTSTP